MKNIIKKRFDASGETEVRTFRGISINNLATLLDSVKEEFSNVEKVALCVGANDIDPRKTDISQTQSSYRDLMKSALRCFPKAQIYCSAILPQRHHRSNVLIWDINKALQHLCQGRVSFLPLHQLWDLVAEDGRVTDNILADKVHLSKKGLGLFVKQLKLALLPYTPSHARSNSHAVRSYADAVRNARSSESVEQPADRPRQAAERAAERSQGQQQAVESETYCTAAQPANQQAASTTHPPPVYYQYCGPSEAGQQWHSMFPPTVHPFPLAPWSQPLWPPGYQLHGAGYVMPARHPGPQAHPAAPFYQH
jgi:lysophospholipase L1-like esterase